MTVGLGMTKGRRDQQVLECQGLGARSGQNRRDKDKNDGGGITAWCLLGSVPYVLLWQLCWEGIVSPFSR